MKKIHIILLLALGLGVSSCFTSYISNKQVMGVQQGMTQRDVESIFGKPDYRRFDGDMEEWEFHRDNGTPVLTSEPMTIIVQFANKKVISMDTFKGYGRPSPHPVVVPPPTTVTTVEVVPGHQPEEIRLMTDTEFNNFIEKLKFTIMSDDQKRLIGQMLDKHDVTSSQCVRIVKEISYTPDQVEMMKKLYPYALYFSIGVSNGLLPLLAYNHAAGNHHRRAQAFRIGSLMSFGFAVLCLVCYEAFATPLVSLFIADAATVRYGAVFLRCMVTAMPMMALCYPMIIQFQAMGRARESLVCSILRKGVLDIPLLYLMDALFPLYGCMWVQPIVDAISLAAALWFYRAIQRGSAAGGTAPAGA